MTSTVRRIMPDGSISSDTYTIAPGGPDRRGQLTLVSTAQPTTTVRVHKLRVLPDDGNLAAPVLAVGTVYKAACPTCGRPVTITEANAATAPCPKHGEFRLSWRTAKGGVRMSDHGGDQKTRKTKTSAVEQPKIDMAAIRAVGELWTKSGLPFDHAEFELSSHVLLLDGAPPRKLHFNTYNGTLGRKGSKGLDLEGFKAGTVGFPLKNDLERERARLRKNGYVLNTGAPPGEGSGVAVPSDPEPAS